MVPWEGTKMEVMLDEESLRWLEQAVGRNQDGVIPLEGGYYLEINPGYPSHWHSASYQSVAHGKEVRDVVDARVVHKRTGAYLDILALSRRPLAPHSHPSPVTSEGEWTCRRGLVYTLSDIFPLVRTQWMGIPTWRPNNVRRMLLKRFSENAFDPEKCHHVYRWVDAEEDRCEEMDDDRIVKPRKGGWVHRFKQVKQGTI
jgi:hypothetical protein